MMKITILFFLVVILLRKTNAQVPGFGSCPKIRAMSDFNVHRYLGLWFEVKKYPFVFTRGGKCITAEYGLNPNGTVSVYNRQLREGKFETISGSARVVSSGVLGVTFPNVPFQGEANYNILETDYDSYAVVYSCVNFLQVVHGKIVWILTRSRFPRQSIIDRAFDVLRINGISTSYIASTDNRDCPDELPNDVEHFRY